MNAVYLDLLVRSVLRWGRLYPQEFLHRITVIYIGLTQLAYNLLVVGTKVPKISALALTTSLYLCFSCNSCVSPNTLRFMFLL